jgi:Helix-turn-helix domain
MSTMREKNYEPFFTWRTAILKSTLPPTTRHVLLTLSCHMNDAGESCFPSIERLSRETGLSRRAVITHLGGAREGGWIRSEKHGFSGQEWARNEYRISWPPEPAETDTIYKGGAPGSPPFSEEREEGPAAQSPEGGARGSSQGGATTGKGVHQVPEGGARGSKGGARSDQKAVHHVHTNSSDNSPSNSSVNSSSPPVGGASAPRSQEQGALERKRDLLWEAMLAGCGIPLHAPHTTTERGRWNKALKILREAGATPEEIKRRCTRYRKIWPKVSLTPTALAANWNTIVSENVGSKPKNMTGDPH